MKPNRPRIVPGWPSFLAPAKPHLLIALAGFLAFSPPGQSALIGYWNFDEGTGTVAGDTSGRATPLNGTLSSGGGGLPLWTAGRFGNALDFNFTSLSAGGLVTVPYNADLRLPGAFTITFWWRPDYVPAASTFPGIVRIGSQSPVPPAANAGWGFFHSQPNTARFKRGNHQPDVWLPALTVGQWYHVALTYDGAGNNIAFVNGVASAPFVTNWPALTTTANLEFGRMDSFDNAGLDDFALFNEGLSLGKARSVYTAPTSLGIDYNLAKMRGLWAIFDGGSGSSGVVDGVTWSYTTTLPGSTTIGDAYVSGGKWYVVLGAGAGVSADIALVGNVYPGGQGLPGTLSLDPAPPAAPSAVFNFDVGFSTNDLINITGDLTLNGNTVVINPLGPLHTGSYRLFNYTGSKTGSLNPVVSHQTRYAFSLDESTPGQINLVVGGGSVPLRWNSASSGSWDLTQSNWFNMLFTTGDRFRQGDEVRFDEAGVYQTNINVALTLFPGSLLVDSASLTYSISGATLSGLEAGLIKSGTSLLNLGGVNNFIGPVNVNAGTLRLTSSGALGATNGGTTIASGATLDLNAQAPGLEPVSVSGTGVGNAGAIVNNGAGSTADALRQVTFTGDTTLGGSGRWDFTGTLVGNGNKLTKVGPNEVWIQPVGSDTGLGDIEIRQGTLGFEGVAFAALGNPAATLTIQSNTTLGFWALNNFASPMAKAVVMNNGIWVNNSGTNYFNGPITLNDSNVFTMSAELFQLGPIGGGGSLNKLGSGRLVLLGTNTYTGMTRVLGGTLALLEGDSIANSSGIALASGTVLSPGAGIFTLSPGQTLSGSGTVQGYVNAGTGTGISPGASTGTLTVTNGLFLTGGAMLTYELSSATTEGGGVNDLINVGGALDLSGVTTLKIVPVGILDLSTPYTLISYAGGLTGDAANFNVISDSRMTFNVDTATPNKIRLQVASGAPAAIEWIGGNAAAPTAWDVKTTANWSGPVNPDVFFSGDTVTFNDLASVFSVSLAGDLSPANTIVAASANTYTFAGPGRIRGGSLTKNGAGTLVLANDGINDYPGTTVINAGTLQVGNGGTSGNLGAAAITDNGTLVFNRGDVLTLANNLVGTGTLEKRGTNVLFLAAGVSNFDGTISITEGILRPQTTNSLGTVVGGTAVNGGTLDVNNLILNREAVTVQGAGLDGLGAIVNNSGTGQQNALRYVTLAGDTTIGGATRWDVRGSPSAFNGDGRNLTKLSSNEVWIVDAGPTDLADIFVNGGTLGFQGSTTLGDEFAQAYVNPGATLGFYGLNASNICNKPIKMNSGTIRNDNGVNRFTGAFDITGSNIFTMAQTQVVASIISGSGGVNKQGAGWLVLENDNTYAGGTVIGAGVVQLGVNGVAGSVLGDITNNGTLSIYRSDTYTLANNVSGLGGMYIRTGNGMIWDGAATVDLAGSVEVGREFYGKLFINPGAKATAGRLMLGAPTSVAGDVVQAGGDVTIGLELRVGHWPTETSSYLMGGGTLNLTNKPTNPDAEKFGILYIGIDGTGLFTQTGGVVSAYGVVLDNRGDTAGTDTLNLEGGRMVIGPSGIASGNPSYLINLGGGTIASSGSWTSALNMTLTGTGGSVTFDTGGYTNVLSGALTGTAGGLIKTGAGTLVLGGADIFVGNTLVNQGTLAVTGTLGAGFDEVRVVSGTLAGTGTITNSTIIEAGGILAPGLSVGTLTFINGLTLSGSTVMEINKAGTSLTSDLVQGGNPLTFGGTLNIVAGGDPLAAGDTFNLFDAASVSPNTTFANVNLPALPVGLVWDTSMLYADGTIKVAAVGGPKINFLLSGARFEMSWDPLATGYTLQGQTNPLSQGITSSNWVDVLTGVINNTYVVEPVPTNQNVFFRLLKP